MYLDLARQLAPGDALASRMTTLERVEAAILEEPAPFPRLHA